jgi:hypothetical protein
MEKATLAADGVVFSTAKKMFPGWIKGIRTTKS